MRPKPDDFHGFFFFEDLVYQTVLDIDPSRTSARQVTLQLLIGRRSLERISLEDFQQLDGFILEPCRSELFGVLLRLSCIDQLPGHQAIFLAHLETGVLSPSTMDSRMPGMDRR